MCLGSSGVGGQRGRWLPRGPGGVRCSRAVSHSPVILKGLSRSDPCRYTPRSSLEWFGHGSARRCVRVATVIAELFKFGFALSCRAQDTMAAMAAPYETESRPPLRTCLPARAARGDAGTARNSKAYKNAIRFCHPPPRRRRAAPCYHVDDAAHTRPHSHTAPKKPHARNFSAPAGTRLDSDTLVRPHACRRSARRCHAPTATNHKPANTRRPNKTHHTHQHTLRLRTKPNTDAGPSP